MLEVKYKSPPGLLHLPPSLSYPSPPPPQVPLYSRYKALDVEGPSVGDNNPLSLDKLMKPNHKKPSPNIKATPLKNKRWILAAGDSSLQ